MPCILCAVLFIVPPLLQSGFLPSEGRRPLNKPDWLGELQPLEKDNPRKSIRAQEKHPSGGSPEIQFDPEQLKYTLKWTDAGTGTNTSAVWEPAVNLSVVVEAQVSHDEDAYTYRYELHNASISSQCLRSFVLQTPMNPLEVMSPDSSWFSRATPKEAWSERYWVWSMTEGDSPLGIAAGQSQGDFTILAGGWPALVDCYARGNAADLVVDFEVPDEISDALPRKMLADALHGKTIGPAPIPEMTPESLGIVLKEMTTFLDDAKTWGWASDEAIEAIKLGWQEVAIAIDQVDLAKIASNLGHFETLFGALEMKKAITNEVSSLYKPRIEWLRQYYAKYEMD